MFPRIIDKAKKLGIDKITGGRAVVSGNILSNRSDIFAANERGPNYLYYNTNGNFVELADDYSIKDTYENGRGTALSDIYYRGRLDIISSNWEGPNRVFVLKNNKFIDIANKEFKKSTSCVYAVQTKMHITRTTLFHILTAQSILFYLIIAVLLLYKQVV